MFIVFECIAASAACGIFPTVFTLAVEWSESKHRVAVNTIINLASLSGSVLTAFLAMYINDFRNLIRCIYVPTMVAAVFVIFVPESVRWLLVMGKAKRMERLLTSAERMNKRHISNETRNKIREECEILNDLLLVENKKLNTNDDQSKNNADGNGLIDFFTSKAMITRFAICSFCWFSAAYVIQGATILSVQMEGDEYVNFIAMCCSGLPSGILALALLKFLGRRTAIFVACMISSCTIVIGKYLLEDYMVLALILILIGKCGGDTMLFTVCLYASEMWPTPLRQTIMALCSTLGRLGFVVAPLAPLLVRYILRKMIICGGQTKANIFEKYLNLIQTWNVSLCGTR